MRTSIWYRNEERQPTKSGRYLCHRGFGMGGMSEGDHELGCLYYDAAKQQWRTTSYDSPQYEVSFVYYWTDADTDQWLEDDGPSVKIRERLKNPHPALAEAWAEVEAAIERYRVIQGLTE